MQGILQAFTGQTLATVSFYVISKIISNFAYYNKL